MVCIDCCEAEQAAFEDRVRTNAVAAERERCARIAESYGGSKFEYHCVGQEIARAIRKGDQP